MKRIYLSLPIIFTISFMFLITSCGKETLNEDIEEEIDEDPPAIEAKYDVLELGEIPIGLWVTPPADYQNTQEYARIKDCGLNFVNGFYFYEPNYKSILNVLDYCEDNGLKFFASKGIVGEDIIKYSQNSDSKLLKKFVDGIKPYKDHSAFAGELLLDEPGKPLFNAIADFSDAFYKAYPDKIAHVNLFPAYATGGIQAPNYENYLNSWIDTQSPKHISYDSYPLLTDGKITTDYFYNLDVVRAKSKFKKIPFWTFIQTLSIAGTPGVPNKREPSEEDIRWQVWSNLAFGAKGIQYFCYWTPGNGTEQFGKALIGQDGKKTVRYDYVKKLNADINAIGKILLNCDAEGVIQTGTSSYKMYAPLYEFADIDSVSGDDSLVGCFTSNDGKKKVLITGLFPDKDTKVVLKLGSNVTAVKTTVNGKTSEKNVADNKLSFEVSAGEAVLVEF